MNEVHDLRAMILQVDALLKVGKVEESDALLTAAIEAAASQPNVAMAPGTPLYCYACGDIEAPLYLFKRMAGKYVPLCYRNGEGCYERSGHPMCDFKDHMSLGCSNHAEWLICYGKDMLMRSKRCCLHAFEGLSDVGEHRVFRIDAATGQTSMHAGSYVNNMAVNVTVPQED